MTGAYNSFEAARATANKWSNANFLDWYGGIVLDAANHSADTMAETRRDLDILWRADARRGNFNTAKLALYYGILTGGLEFGVKTAVNLVNLPATAKKIIGGNISLADVKKGVISASNRKWDVLMSIPDHLVAGEIASLSHDMTMEGAEIYLYAEGVAGIVNTAVNVVKSGIGIIRTFAERAADGLNAGRLVPAVGVLDAGGEAVAVAAGANSFGKSIVPAIMMAAGDSASDGELLYNGEEIAKIKAQVDECVRLLDTTYSGRNGGTIKSALYSLANYVVSCSRSGGFILVKMNVLDRFRKLAIADGADNLASAIEELGRILSKRHGTPTMTMIRHFIKSPTL
ncbi:MAG: hypothetical protein HYY43_00905 [Deltaproteobacteria bacterium]|nr:hypothetical protein [Deltaproteobacteria bacterium]MBI2974140.1 hypothetical protein [Deltaproteobacteria bacterium]